MASELQSLLSSIFSIFLDQPLTLLFMGVLLCLSAMFSGSETALFSLTPSELNRIRADKGVTGRAIYALHDDLRRLLLTILFGNMAVNILFFSIGTKLGSSMGTAGNHLAALILGIGCLVTVIIFGEVVPKQVAIGMRLPLLRIAALPLYGLHKVIRRPLITLDAFVSACERAFHIDNEYRQQKEEELRLLIELSSTDGVISSNERDLIDSIVDLPNLRLKDIMTPRVDAVSVRCTASIEDVLAIARSSSHVKLPVFDPERDDYVGWVDARDFFNIEHTVDLEKFVKPMTFFSEHDRGDLALSKFRTTGDRMAAVVDERGAIVGFLTQHDLTEEILGRLGEYGAPPQEPIRTDTEGDGYLISGGLSVKEWREYFDYEGHLPHSATMGGLVTSALGRPARPGDRVNLDEYELQVVSARRNRVISIRMKDKGKA